MPFLFYEWSEGGHGSLSPVEAAERDALVFTYLTKRLMDTTSNVQ